MFIEWIDFYLCFEIENIVWVVSIVYIGYTERVEYIFINWGAFLRNQPVLEKKMNFRPNQTWMCIWMLSVYIQYY